MSIYVAPRTIVAQKASPQGPAAGILQTEYPLLSILGKQTEQQISTMEISSMRTTLRSYRTEGNRS